MEVSKILKIKNNLHTNKPLVKKFNEYKSRAKSNNIKFNLNLFDFYLLATNSCYSCGNKSEELLGIDRVDNKLGYTVKNSRTCCWDCNRLKSNKSLQNHADYIGRFSQESKDHLLKLDKDFKNLATSNLDTFPELFNDKANTELLELVGIDNFQPRLLSVGKIFLDQKDSMFVFLKSFYINGFLLNFVDLDEHSNKVPTSLKTDLRKTLHDKQPSSIKNKTYFNERTTTYLVNTGKLSIAMKLINDFCGSR